MESFKANLIILLFLAGVGALAYWAVGSLRTNNNTLADRIEIEDVGPVVTSSPAEAPGLGTEIADNDTPLSSGGTTTPEPSESPTPASSDDDANLIGELQDLIDDKILMKKGSRGTRVGTVQKFLIEYGFKVSVDNDYGDSTVTAVKKFQTEQKLAADGQAGPSTYQKMIDWLKAN